MNSGLNCELRYLLGLVLSSLLVFTSCEYEPKDVYERDVVEAQYPPDIMILKLDLNDDTVYYYASEMKIAFSFKSTEEDKDISYVKFLIDSKELASFESNEGEFSFEEAGLSSGNHTLKIEIYTHTGSTSLADQLGAEVFYFSKTWVLINVNVDRIKPKAEVENGYLKLTFPEYKNSDLKFYEIYQVLNGEENLVASVKNNVYIDSNYVGEGGSFRSKVMTNYGLSFRWSEVFLEKDLPSINFYADEDNNYSIRWSKSKYFNAMTKYYIIFSNFTRDEIHYLSFFNPNDTVLDLPNTEFYDSVTASLRTVPGEGSYMYNTLTRSHYECNLGAIYVGVPLNFNFRGKPYPINEDEFVYSTMEYVYKCSISRNEVLESKRFTVDGIYRGAIYDFSISPHGNYLIGYFNGNYILSSAYDLQNYTVHNIKSLIGDQLYYMPLSDFGTSIVPLIDSSVYYDFVNDRVLGSIKTTDFGQNKRVMSSDGKYFFIPTDSMRYYRYHEGVIDLLWKAGGEDRPEFYDISPTDSNELVIWNNSVFYVKRCDDFSTISEFPLHATKIFNVDFYKNQLLAYDPGHLYVVDITNGDLLYDVPLNLSLLPEYEQCFLLNNTIVGAMSISYKLN